MSKHRLFILLIREVAACGGFYMIYIDFITAYQFCAGTNIHDVSETTISCDVILAWQL